MAQKEATLLIKIKETGADALDSIKGGMLGITAAVGVAVAAIIGFAKVSLDSFREQEEATNKLSQAMANAGTFSVQLREKYLEQARALQQVTTFGDEQIINAQAILQTFSRQKEVSKELTIATLNLAAAKHMDLASAAELVGKTIGTETNALARQGVEIDKNLTGSEKTAAVTKKLNDLYHGQAEALAEGLGVFARFKNTLSDFYEDVGQAIAPAVIATTQSFMDMFNAMTGGGSIIQGTKDAFNFLAVTMFSIEYAGREIGDFFSVVLPAAFEAFSAAAKLNFGKAKDVVNKAMSEMANNNLENETRLNGQLDSLAAKQGKRTEENIKRDEDLLKQSIANKKTIRDEEAAKALEKANTDFEDAIATKAAQGDIEAAVAEGNQLKLLEAQQKFLDLQYKNAKTASDKQRLLSAMDLNQELINKEKERVAEEEKNKKKVKDREDTLATIATLQTSNNKTLAVIGKAAALTQIAIDTPVAVGKALAAFPPPFNFIAAGLVGAAMAAQAAKVSGIQLAEGGIVMPRPGGTQATIGEAGQAEAVIPLDRAGEFGLGGGTSINFYGPVLGDSNQARQFALAIDRELLTLRRNNESLAFDKGVI